MNHLMVSAYLENRNSRIPVTAKYASKYSLWIEFEQEYELFGNDSLMLIIQNNGSSLKIGPCRFIADSSNGGYCGHIIFLQDIYDTTSLLSKNKAVRLKSVFRDLPALLARKEQIFPAFKEFTQSLRYDLSVYKSLFDQMDSDYSDEPSLVRTAIQDTLIQNEGQHFRKYLDEQLAELKNQVADFSAKQHQVHGFYFRKQLWEFIMCSPLMARTNIKPRGYAGDSKIMQMIYENGYRGDSTFAKILYKHGLNHTAAQSVRNRIFLIVRQLNAFQKSQNGNAFSRVEVLSLGCGPALELFDILKSPDDCDKYHFALFDQDQKALAEAAGLISRLEKKLSAKIVADFIRGSVRTMLFSRSLKEKYGQYHFIYSMGLFDYLSAPVAKAVLTRLYHMIKPGGEIVIGNFHVSNPSRFYMEYWCDWSLYLRNEEEFVEISSDVRAAERKIIYEDTGSQMFLHLKKKAT